MERCILLDRLDGKLKLGDEINKLMVDTKAAKKLAKASYMNDAPLVKAGWPEGGQNDEKRGTRS